MAETTHKQTCPQCKGHPTTNEAPEGAAMSYWTTCDYCMGEGTVPLLFTIEQVEKAVKAMWTFWHANGYRMGVQDGNAFAGYVNNHLTFHEQGGGK